MWRKAASQASTIALGFLCQPRPSDADARDSDSRQNLKPPPKPLQIPPPPPTAPPTAHRRPVSAKRDALGARTTAVDTGKGVPSTPSSARNRGSRWLRLCRFIVHTTRYKEPFGCSGHCEIKHMSMGRVLQASTSLTHLRYVAGVPSDIDGFGLVVRRRRHGPLARQRVPRRQPLLDRRQVDALRRAGAAVYITDTRSAPLPCYRPSSHSTSIARHPPDLPARAAAGTWCEPVRS